MKVPDWILFTLILAVVLWALFSRQPDADVADPPPVLMNERVLLPEAGILDDEVLVQVGELTDGVGTAFALDRRGLWMTARHVVDGCSRVGLQVGNRQMLPVNKVETNTGADIAFLYTLRAPNPLEIAVRDDFQVGEEGYHIGYPQGRPGEATSRLLSRSRLLTRGRYRNNEGALAWAETGRTRSISGSLAGISGGPVFDSNGRVVGVTLAESVRRGRIYTTSPETISQALDQVSLTEIGSRTPPISTRNYGARADRLRAQLSVVKVVCRT